MFLDSFQQDQLSSVLRLYYSRKCRRGLQRSDRISRCIYYFVLLCVLIWVGKLALFPFPDEKIPRWFHWLALPVTLIWLIGERWARSVQRSCHLPEGAVLQEEVEAMVESLPDLEADERYSFSQLLEALEDRDRARGQKILDDYFVEDSALRSWPHFEKITYVLSQL